MKRILIVDDEKDIRDLLSDQLSELKVEIVTAADGLEALELIRTQKFNAILCDVTMPRMTGIELLKTIRKEGNHTPFVILTGYASNTAAEALSLGAFDFLQKPWDEYGLMMVMRKAITQVAA